VWEQLKNGTSNIYANRYVPGTGWGAVKLIKTDNGDAYRPQIALDSSGNAIAVWRQWDGNRYNIWANRYDSGRDVWVGAELIETDDAASAFDPKIAFDFNSPGNAIAVWHQNDGNRYNIWANRYDSDKDKWVGAELIETGDNGDAFNPQIAVDSSGNAIAVWRQYDDSKWNIYANRYDSDAGTWGTAELIETGDGPVFDPQIAVDSSGNAIAVWRQYGSSRWNIYANRYVPGTGWGTAELIETDDGDAFNPQIAVDSSGNAIAVWRQKDGTKYNIYANCYVPNEGGWGTAELIETDDGDASSPQIAVDSSGNAIAVWEQSDGERTNIWTNRFE